MSNKNDLSAIDPIVQSVVISAACCACGFYQRRGWQRVGITDTGEVRFERDNRAEQNK